MRSLIGVALAVALSAPGVEAQPFSPADVSILLAPPEDANSPLLPVPESSLSPATVAQLAAVVAQAGRVAGPSAEQAIDPGVFADLRVTSVRIDPGAPGLTPAFAVFGRAPQVRLVAQPVTLENGRPVVRDEAVHLVYTFGKPARTPACGFRFEADIPAFERAVDDLRALKATVQDAGVTTDGMPLGVHPAFASATAAPLLVAGLDAFVRSHATEDRLFAVSVAGIPAGRPEPWIFLAMSRDPETGAVRPVPGTAIRQAAGAPAFAQMLSFVGGPDGAVIPPGLARNLLPVDCLANFLPQTQAADGQGRSTSTLFAPGANTPAAAAEVAEVVADPARAHFFNTDCVSCHSETRREIDAAADGAAASAAIAQAEGIAPEAMPRGPDDSGRAFDKWNVRAFGWYPGFGPAGARAHPTVVRRAARETAEVVACLNSGNWRDASQPCLGSEEAALEPTQQGWASGIRERFYHSSQGSSIMPAAYFTALERADGGRFAAPENLARYGFLASGADALGLNPLGLPVGLALTGPEPEAGVGLNCAACHTADVVANGRRLRVDGAPAALDFDRFVADLASAVQDTIQLKGKDEPSPAFAAFLATVAETAPDLATPEVALDFAADFLGQAALRHPVHPSGPGRVDALTQIVNALAVSDLGVPENLRVPAAPTSYPALWLTPRLEFVQWNLTASDPLGRNIGQAQGVFGSTDLKGPPPFETSAKLAALQDYERWIERLEPPRWPEDILGPIDANLAEQGRDLFATNCEGCHNAPPFRMSEPADNLTGQTFITVGAVPQPKAATDAIYTRALLSRWVETGELAAMFGGDRAVPAGSFFTTVVGATTKAALAAAGTPPEAIPTRLRLRPASHKDCLTPDGQPGTEPCGYQPPGRGAALKAGPLLGLWATGPYLHNGSVRTVYELLSPPAERATEFWVGDRTLDTERLGFVSTEGGFLFDTTVPGNGAGGHEFWPSPFTHDERMALLEYLKDPERFPIER